MDHGSNALSTEASTEQKIVRIPNNLQSKGKTRDYRWIQMDGKYKETVTIFFFLYNGLFSLITVHSRNGLISQANNKVHQHHDYLLFIHSFIFKKSYACKMIAQLLHRGTCSSLLSPLCSPPAPTVWYTTLLCLVLASPGTAGIQLL